MSNIECRMKIEPRGFAPRGSGKGRFRVGEAVIPLLAAGRINFESKRRSFFVEGDEVLRRHFVEIAFGHDGVSEDAFIQLLIEAFFVEIRFSRGDCAGGGRGHHLFDVALGVVHLFGLTVFHRRVVGDLDATVVVHAGAGGDQAAHDHVLLQAAQIIDAARDRRLGQHAGRLLERRRRDERVGRERGLSDAEQQRFGRRGLAVFVLDAGVLVGEAEAVDLLFEQEVGVADVLDPHPAQHLADDHLDVFVVDVYALEPVDLLDCVDQVALQRLHALHGQDVVRVERAVHQRLAGAHAVALLDVDVRAARYRILALLAGLGRNADLLRAFGDIAELDHAVDLAHHGRLARLARLEQLDDARQTADDVLRPGDFARNLGDHVARRDLVAVRDHEVGADGHRVGLERFAGIGLDLDARLALLVGRVHDDRARQAGHLVDLFVNGDVLDQVAPMHRPADLGQDREGVRVPLGDLLALLDVPAVGDVQRSAISDRITFDLAPAVVDDQHRAVAVHGDDPAFSAFDRVEVVVFDVTARAGFVRRLLGDLRRRAADVESAHRQLRAGLADALGGDDADRLADVHDLPCGQVAAVALDADSAARLAGEHRADAHAFDARVLDFGRHIFGDLRVDPGQDFAGDRVENVFKGDATDDAFAQAFNDVARFGDRLRPDALDRAAIRLRDDHVLRHVYKTARQVARIGGLERRVGQTLARAVRGDEVLQHVQTFAEIGADRGLDDFARRLGHQAAHSGELPDLLLVSARPGIGHDQDRVQLAGVLLAPLHFAEHLVGDLFGHLRPDGDDLVVSFAVSDHAVLVLLLDLDHFGLGVRHERRFVRRRNHVVNADRKAGFRRVEESELFQAVEHLDGDLMPKAQETVIDQALQPFLPERAVDVRHLFREMVVEQHAPDGRVDGAIDFTNRGLDHVLCIALGVEVDQTALVAQAYLGLRRDLFGVEREHDLFRRGEGAAFALRALQRAGHVVTTEHDVLRRHGDGLPRGRREDVVRREHQDLRLDLRFGRERDVDRHLVAVEVGVEGRADERMNLDRLAFDQHRLEGLDAQAVERRRAVEQDRVILNHLLEDVPDHVVVALDHLLGLLDSRGVALGFEPVVDERLEQLQGHLLRQAALVQLQLGADDDH